MNILSVLRKNKSPKSGRGQLVFEAVSAGYCVECRSPLFFSGSTFLCKKCGWSGEFQK